ncbi:MAG: RagB/SusD domain protein [Anaerophaga sp.]|jgi:hypothetical protein|nr:RagB/SusD domain protein [Anaerophaga sp.]
MKSIRYILIILLSYTIITGCDESEFLKEKPLDIYSPDNSMETSEHFQTSLNHLYNRVRNMVWNISADSRYAFFYATDLAFNATDYYVPAKLNDYKNVMVPTFDVVLNIWKESYDIISNANIILSRLPDASQVSDTDKDRFRGETLFLRAFAYRNLCHLYGGVPLLLEEVAVPRRDYVRASREETYKQIQKDLEEAVSLLSDIDKVRDGKVNKQAAQHLLTEIYISLGLYDDAIRTATSVIDHPATGLMTTRFGSRKDEPGDVYWDLFRLNNQNRSTSGNTEGLWVIQNEYQNAGSSDWDMPRTIIPFYQNIQIEEINEAGQMVKTTAFLGVTDGKGGRGIGWMQGTKHFFNEIWDDKNDIRNSSFNIIRDLRIDNPASPAFGKWLVADGYSKQVDSIRYWYPIITKFSRMNNFPEDLWVRNNGEPVITAFGEHLLLNNAGSNYKDEYMFRLAETYLLRAEAYLNKGDKSSATADINIIRARANASLIDESKMDIDFILDERLRELYYEEFRMVTLTRMGKLVDRARRYNPKTGPTIEDYHNLWPIPYSEIERNINAKIEQNPGY